MAFVLDVTLMARVGNIPQTRHQVRKKWRIPLTSSPPRRRLTRCSLVSFRVTFFFMWKTSLFCAPVRKNNGLSHHYYRTNRRKLGGFSVPFFLSSGLQSVQLWREKKIRQGFGRTTGKISRIRESSADSPPYKSAEGQHGQKDRANICYSGCRKSAEKLWEIIAPFPYRCLFQPDLKAGRRFQIAVRKPLGFPWFQNPSVFLFLALANIFPKCFPCVHDLCYHMTNLNEVIVIFYRLIIPAEKMTQKEAMIFIERSLSDMVSSFLIKYWTVKSSCE